MLNVLGKVGSLTEVLTNGSWVGYNPPVSPGVNGDHFL